ncbi:hypothetical protein L198_02631 [Cryptococcus wingfieldii CBS 7118]|uniref:PPM-type phosphatase domain-containing protein n=1 Tax=Cryptococcus wingfieldii CBS 7118 TaxID=1295528 RepID=A0A1E3JPR9_9TREE|nr:hypothetical protein L198_02631 [Cryptococcus wingfieldii CBS 7118]ODO01902.1 hypothetical protein L198_02631 [Cryptococcus wingfieldii CBS 7118]
MLFTRRAALGLKSRHSVRTLTNSPSPPPTRPNGHLEEGKETLFRNMRYLPAIGAVSLTGVVIGVTAYCLTPLEQSEEDKEVPFKDTTIFSGTPARIRSIDGQQVEWRFEDKHYYHPLLSDRDAERMLTPGHKVTEVNRRGNPLKTFDFKILFSADTGEDRCNFEVVTRSDLAGVAQKSGKGEFWWKSWWDARNRVYPKGRNRKPKVGDGSEDVIICSVWDGHSGHEMAELLKRGLHGCLAWNIGKELNRSKGWTETIKTSLGFESSSGESFRDVHFEPESFSNLISNTFLAVDQDVVTAPSRILYSGPSNTLSPHLPPHLPSSLAYGAFAGGPGACCATAIVDVADDRFYVANVGDTRCIARWWNEADQKWRCDVITEDCMGDNPKESARILSEHPEDEQDTAMYNGGNGNGNRVLGQLQLTRVFGDSDYKIDHDDVNRALDQCEYGIRWPRFDEVPCKTPPYVAAKPEVKWRDMHPDNGDELKFLMLGTDGLFDRLTSEEVSHLLAGHHSNPKQDDVDKVVLPMLHPHYESLSENEHPFPKEEMQTEGGWVFEDKNAAIHLIRNSLGGADRELRRQFLSLRKPGVRQARDDITACVLWFDEKGPREERGDMTSV